MDGRSGQTSRLSDLTGYVFETEENDGTAGDLDRSESSDFGCILCCRPFARGNDTNTNAIVEVFLICTDCYQTVPNENDAYARTASQLRAYGQMKAYRQMILRRLVMIVRSRLSRRSASREDISQQIRQIIAFRWHNVRLSRHASMRFLAASLETMMSCMRNRTATRLRHRARSMSCMRNRNPMRLRRRARSDNGSGSMGPADLSFGRNRTAMRLRRRARSDNGSDSMEPADLSFGRNRTPMRLRHRARSDNGSDSMEPADLSFGETDSIVSGDGYGGESDASVYGNGPWGQEILVALDNVIRMASDTDIDPMPSSLHMLSYLSEVGEWEAADAYEVTSGFTEQGRRYLEFGADSPWLRWRDHQADTEETDMTLDVGNFGDYRDNRLLEELCEQFTEIYGSRSWRRAPPTSSCRNSLPLVVISEMHERTGDLLCAVCMDPMIRGSAASQLPCLHLYHPPCILQWLSRRNSCPVCRCEPPTYDPDYEQQNRNAVSQTGYREVQQQNVVAANSLPDSEVDDSHHVDQGMQRHGAETGQESLSRLQNTRGWMQLAGPLVSIVGFALVMWLSPSSGGSKQVGSTHRGEDTDCVQRSNRRNTVQEQQIRGNRGWWSFCLM